MSGVWLVLNRELPLGSGVFAGRETFKFARVESGRVVAFNFSRVVSGGVKKLTNLTCLVGSRQACFVYISSVGLIM